MDSLQEQLRDWLHEGVRRMAIKREDGGGRCELCKTAWEAEEVHAAGCVARAEALTDYRRALRMIP